MPQCFWNARWTRLASGRLWSVLPSCSLPGQGSRASRHLPARSYRRRGKRTSTSRIRVTSPGWASRRSRWPRSRRRPSCSTRRSGSARACSRSSGSWSTRTAGRAGSSLGSASPDLVGLASESLAGRVELLELPGLRAVDVGQESLPTLWRRGGLPPSFLSSDQEGSRRWRDSYISTFLERDLGNLGFRFPAVTMRRFWTMVAHYHGQTWNGAELARALGSRSPRCVVISTPSPTLW